jgi:hypothetical protein
MIDQSGDELKRRPTIKSALQTLLWVVTVFHLAKDHPIGCVPSNGDQIGMFVLILGVNWDVLYTGSI